jgi:serine phosphatase RsbU (regulator of sigma subunit)
MDEAIATERLKIDFEIAKRVQNSLIPDSLPEVDWLETSVHFELAQEVGGDYYDFILKNGSAVLMVGDVSGKGISAAFHVAELKGILSSLKEYLLNPHEFMPRLNDAVKDCFQRGIFLTLTYCRVDQNPARITYARAGHCPTLFYKASTKKAVYIEDKGLGLGIAENNIFNTELTIGSQDYQEGDILVLYSDGLPEARNLRTMEEYGYDRLKEILQQIGSLSVDQIQQAILRDVHSFLQGAIVQDDFTLMILKFKALNQP